MVEMTCPVCGVSYLADPGRLKHGRQTTCSRQCSYILRARENTKATTTPCVLCGEPVTKAPSLRAQARQGKIFCSPKCHYAARASRIVVRNVVKPYMIPQTVRDKWSRLQTDRNMKRKMEGRYGHSEETKRKLSKATALAMAQGKFPRVSKIETAVKDELSRLGLKFICQWPVTAPNWHAGVADFFLSDLNLVVEVNGTFWHADPRTYPNGPIHPIQKRKVALDKRKEAVLKVLGISLVTLWEYDIHRDLKGIINQALAPFLPSKSA